MVINCVIDYICEFGQKINCLDISAAAFQSADTAI